MALLNHKRGFDPRNDFTRDILAGISNTNFPEKIEGLTYASGNGAVNLSDRERILIGHLIRIHGPGMLTRGSRGKELRLPDPTLLMQDGSKELASRHLYVNIDKCLNPQCQKDLYSAREVKSGKVYNINDLLDMTPVEARNIPNVRKVSRKLVSATMDKFMEMDENGKLIPLRPGKVTPVTELASDHPAIEYLASRKFTNLQQLYDQFRLSWCYEEVEKGPYGNLAGGFRKTPQGRLIFFIDQLGVNKGWQARIPEKTIGKIKYYYHPYKNEYVPIGVHTEDGLRVMDMYMRPDKPPNEIVNCKYIIGLHTPKNDTLMGFDAALKWNKENGDPGIIGVVEGALDAGRLGPPFVNVMGSRLSESQANLIANFFKKVYYVCDDDSDKKNQGRALDVSIQRMLSDKNLTLTEIKLPPGIHDPGDLTPDQADQLTKQYIL